MTALQWALLVLGLVAVVLTVVLHRRRRVDEAIRRDRARTESAGDDDEFLPIMCTMPPRDTDDLWGQPGSGGSRFDEFGVSEVRVRGSSRKPPVVDAPPPDDEAPPARQPDSEDRQVEDAPAEKVVVVYIAEREGTHILGPQIHAALRDCGLSFGERAIYHRLHQGRPMFSVASLLKPGILDPADADRFSTPGLTVFTVLPGVADPVRTVQEMLDTARRLADRLHAELYDERRQPLDPAGQRRLVEDVRQWSQATA